LSFGRAAMVLFDYLSSAKMKTLPFIRVNIKAALALAFVSVFFYAPGVLAFRLFKKTDDASRDQRSAEQVIAAQTPKLPQDPPLSLEEFQLGQIFGPINLLKVMKTPFGANLPQPSATASRSRAPQTAEGLEIPFNAQIGNPDPALKPISLSRLPSRLHQALADRLLSSRLYLPGGMVLGRTAEFTVKSRAGQIVALAMADRNTGAKSIGGHTIRLGPDRKVVAVGVVPESGVLNLTIETPIQGDQVGAFWYFEAALWSKADFSDLEIATPVTYLGQETAQNGVMTMAEPDGRRGVRITPDYGNPMEQQQRFGDAHLDSSKP